MTWIDTKEAARLLSEHNEREISSAYVRTLASKGLVKSKVSDDGKSLLVQKADFENRTVFTRAGRRVENRVRDQRSGRPGGRPRKDQKKPETAG